MKVQNSYGFILSLIFHFLLFLLPVSLVASKQFKEVEIFIMGEQPQTPAVSKEGATAKEKKEVSPPLIAKKTFPAPCKHNKSPEVKETLLSENKSIITETRDSSSPPETASFSPGPDFSPISSPQSEPGGMGGEGMGGEEVDFGSMNGPQFLHQEMPVYPLIARRLGKEGRVVLRLTIDENGNLLNVEVIEGAGFGLTEAAVEAVKKSTFLPARSGGVPVKSKALLPIKFTLRSEG